MIEKLYFKSTNDFFLINIKNVFVFPLPWCVKNEFEIKKMQKMNENKKVHKS